MSWVSTHGGQNHDVPMGAYPGHYSIGISLVYVHVHTKVKRTAQICSKCTRWWIHHSTSSHFQTWVQMDRKLMTMVF